MVKNLSKIVKFNVKTSKMSSLNVSRKFRHAALRMPNTEHQNEKKNNKIHRKNAKISKKKVIFMCVYNFGLPVYRGRKNVSETNAEMIIN